jgi:hypothetical protein
MAKINSIGRNEIAPGVMVTAYSWGLLFEGHDEDLITAKIISPECVPGMPGQGKTVATMERAGRKIHVRRSSKSSLRVREEYSSYDAVGEVQLGTTRWDEFLRLFYSRYGRPRFDASEDGERGASVEQFIAYLKGYAMASNDFACEKRSSSRASNVIDFVACRRERALIDA